MPLSPGHPAHPASEPSRLRRRPFWNLQNRASALLVATAALVIGLILWVDHEQSRHIDLMFGERVRESAVTLEKLMTMRAEGARAHADDYTRWDDMVTFARKPDPDWARINIENNIATFQLDAAWVLDSRFEKVYAANPSGQEALRSLPVPLPHLAHFLREQPIRHFFSRSRGKVVEIWTSPIHHTSDDKRLQAPAGYYVVARQWNADRLRELGLVAGGTPFLAPLGFGLPGSRGDAGTGDIEVVRELPGIGGSPIAELVFRTGNPVVAHVHDSMRTSHRVVLLGTLLVLLLSWFALGSWVGRPLGSITRALATQDPAVLHQTARRHDELGHLAQLVEEFFDQREGLIQARAAAEAGARAKSVFLANTSHELRTPMHGILSFSRFGVRDAMTADREELLDNFRNIEECGESLLLLLNDLLDLSKFEAGRMAFSFGEVSLADLANEAADQFASFVQECRLDLRVEAADRVPDVLADRLKLLQVFRNLLSNAAKFTPPDGQVKIRIEARGPLARVTVRDSGNGIPEAELRTIFDKFTQASNTNPRIGGTGLGLAICREIVEAHDGRIWAENLPQGGAALVFELPFAGPVSAHEEFVEEIASPTPRPSGGDDGDRRAA